MSNAFPSRSLPTSTILSLEDAKGAVLWQMGKGSLLSAEVLGKVAYVAFILSSGQVYRYAVVGRGGSLEMLRVRVGKNTYTLNVLLKNRNVTIAPDGRLVAVKAPVPSAQPKTHAAPAHTKP